ncbi:MAG TPA: GNAT family N-acetyltransferase [Thermoleophilaceae bacterium]|nr:GNAT family N-acetyltransferase [Thermoleophilaceae bacterium]
MPALVRRPLQGEALRVAQLLHLSAPDMFDRFAGNHARALRTLERALGAGSTSASADCVWVAELGNEPAGAMAAFPVSEGPARARAFLRLSLRASPPWRWPSAVRLYLIGGRAAPPPPAAAFYIDALATDERFRRRGVARALLAEAERQAAEQRLTAVALDTTAPNTPARRLYASAGFEEVAYTPAGRGLPGFVALVKRLS